MNAQVWTGQWTMQVCTRALEILSENETKRHERECWDNRSVYSDATRLELGKRIRMSGNSE